MEHCPCTIRPVYGEAHDNIRVLGDTGCLINICYDNPHLITLVHPHLPRNIAIAECLYMYLLYITLVIKHIVKRTSAYRQHLLNNQFFNINYADCCRKLVCYLHISSLWLCICSMRVLSNRDLLYKLKGIQLKDTYCGMIIVA